MTEAALRRRLATASNRKLRAVHLRGTPEAPTDTDVITRTGTPVEVEPSKLADQIRKQDAILLREGLQKAGVRQDTLEKLEILKGLSDNAGRWLVSSLDLSHRMMIFLNIQLLERAMDIKSTYLEDETLEDEYKIEWQKAYNEIVDVIRKSYEATLSGTQAMARIMGNGKREDDGKAVPGFQPIKARPKSPKK